MKSKNKFIQDIFGDTVPIKLGDITLIPLNKKHLDFYYQLYSLPKVVKYQRVDRCRHKNDAAYHIKSRLNRQCRHQSFYWVISHCGRQVGGFCLNRIKANQRYFSIGFTIQPKWWDRGLATSVVKRFCRYAFQSFQPTVIRANCAEKNLASRRVLEKSGFVHCYTRKRGVRIGKKWQTEYFYRCPNPKFQ